MSTNLTVQAVQSELNKLENELTSDCECLIYDECAELKRKIQLKREERIFSFKTLFDLNVNSDESELNSGLIQEVNEINDSSESLIKKVENYYTFLSKKIFSTFYREQLSHFISNELSLFKLRFSEALNGQDLEKSPAKIAEIKEDLNFLGPLVLG
jgi:hypothetical protein